LRIASARVSPFQVCVRSPGDDAAAGQSAPECEALFVRPDHNVEWVPRGVAALVQDLDGFNRGQRAEIAVEIASLRDRIDVRAEKDWLGGGIAARTPGEDVTGGIDARFDASLAHQPHYVLSTRDIGIRVRGARDAAFEAAAGRAPV
jgi:hypothetical protein